jgi:hypothetical protein
MKPSVSTTGATARDSRAWDRASTRFWRRTSRVVERAAYFPATRGPLVNLVFIVPLLMAYEIGIGSTHHSEAVRGGADAWIRATLRECGLTDRWFVPLALTLGLLAWQAVEPGPWRVRPRLIAGMLLESGGFAIVLYVVSRWLDPCFAPLDGVGEGILGVGVSGGTPGWSDEVIGFLGAGIFEEAIFRLLMIPLIFWLARLAHTPEVISGALAISVSAILFSLAHHAGMPGEPFTWYAFVFRWVAGIAFAAIFVTRGFGIAVGSHALYDIFASQLS